MPQVAPGNTEVPALAVMALIALLLCSQPRTAASVQTQLPAGSTRCWAPVTSLPPLCLQLEVSASSYWCSSPSSFVFCFVWHLKSYKTIITSSAYEIPSQGSPSMDSVFSPGLGLITLARLTCPSLSQPLWPRDEVLRLAQTHSLTRCHGNKKGDVEYVTRRLWDKEKSCWATNNNDYYVSNSFWPQS